MRGMSVLIYGLAAAIMMLSAGCGSKEQAGGSGGGPASTSQPAGAPGQGHAGVRLAEFAPASAGGGTSTTAPANSTATGSAAIARGGEFRLTETRPPLPLVWSVPLDKYREGADAVFQVEAQRTITSAGRVYSVTVQVWCFMGEYKDEGKTKPKFDHIFGARLDESGIEDAIGSIEYFKALPKGKPDPGVSESRFSVRVSGFLEFLDWNFATGQFQTSPFFAKPTAIVNLDAMRKALVAGREEIRKFRAVKPAVDLTGTAP